MYGTGWTALGRSCAMTGVAALVAACSNPTPIEPLPRLALPQAMASRDLEQDPAIVALRRATARYHSLDLALKDGFVFLHACESGPGEGPVGDVYVDFARLDSFIDPEKPEALIYRPLDTGRLQLVGVEFAVPDVGQEPPQFLGATFQREPEFGVFGLHAWIWLDNPDGLFAEFNPRITCGAE